MNGIVRFIFVIIWFAIGLAMAGTLVDATRVMGHAAVKAHQHGGISYGKWNRELVNQKK